MLLGSDILPLDKSKFVQALEESRYERSPLPSCHATEKPNHRHLLLCACRQRPRRRCATEQRDELAPPHHSITSSARARREGGTVRPSALAVVRLMTRSNLVGCSTGRSAGFAPRRILST